MTADEDDESRYVMTVKKGDKSKYDDDT